MRMPLPHQRPPPLRFQLPYCTSSVLTALSLLPVGGSFVLRHLSMFASCYCLFWHWRCGYRTCMVGGLGSSPREERSRKGLAAPLWCPRWVVVGAGSVSSLNLLSAHWAYWCCGRKSGELFDIPGVSNSWFIWDPYHGHHGLSFLPRSSISWSLAATTGGCIYVAETSAVLVALIKLMGTHWGPLQSAASLFAPWNH
jgi:hypothetical protein